MAQISSKKIQAEELAKLRILPQTIKNLNIEFNDETIIENLSKYGTASFEIHTNDINFHGYGRVRFNNVRIFFLGIDISKEKKIEVNIATSGTYFDINPTSVDQVNNFVGLEVYRGFVYITQEQTVVIDGDSADRYANDYFMPTPFTKWTIQVKYQSDEPFDYSRITGFFVSFTSEATAIQASL